MSMLSRRIGQLVTLSPLQWRAVISTQFLLPVINRQLRKRGLKSIMASNTVTDMNPVSMSGEAQEQARALAFAVNASCRHGIFRGTCLQRSLVLCRLLAREGITHQLKIGAGSGKNEFTAHAWVEVEGAVINDHVETVGKFCVFD